MADDDDKKPIKPKKRKGLKKRKEAEAAVASIEPALETPPEEPPPPVFVPPKGDDPEPGPELPAAVVVRKVETEARSTNFTVRMGLKTDSAYLCKEWIHIRKGRKNTVPVKCVDDLKRMGFIA